MGVFFEQRSKVRTFVPYCKACGVHVHGMYMVGRTVLLLACSETKAALLCLFLVRYQQVVRPSIM